jgi:EAL domain-containing protein (putative c-di-GMP-specific phosphodiesterase class I)
MDNSVLRLRILPPVRKTYFGVQKRACRRSEHRDGRTLGLDPVADGIEMAEDWECLQALGCDMARGYFVTRPFEWRVIY